MPQKRLHTQSQSTASSRSRKRLLPPYGSCTDIGLVRDHNEDSLVVAPPLFAVADGMGGHEAGEVASEIAATVVARRAPITADGDELARATIAANRSIIQASYDGHGKPGMGTTLTAAVIEGTRIVVSQVGDSRAYLLHEGVLQRITRDHSLMADLIEAGEITPEQARVHPQRSIITRALGSDPNTLPDIYEMNVSAGDRLLLCSDGLSGMVEDPMLETLLSSIADPQKCAKALIDEALANGGHDNVTAIVVDIIDDTHEVTLKKEKTKGRLGAIMLVCALLAAIIGGGAGMYTYAHNCAYIKLGGDEIRIYQGIPGSFMGLKISEYVETVPISPGQIPVSAMRAVSGEGLKTSSVDEARALVKTWQDQAAEDELLGGDA